MRIQRTAFALCYCVAAIGFAALQFRDEPKNADPDPLEIALSLHAGENELDRRIRKVQQRARTDATRSLEPLGWAFVAKARESHDPGYYRLAEQCALALEALEPDTPEASLLRGHVLHALHRFAEAEVLARRAVETRGAPLDHGLLGDTLLDQGRVAEAAISYQTMVDLRPDAQSFIRAAELRFVSGDIPGAVAAGSRAARAANPRRSSDFAWVWSRLATYQLASGDFAASEASSRVALRVAPEHAGALFAHGRVLLATGRFEQAASVLFHASQRDPHPETLWSWAEALRAAERIDAAETVEQALVKGGPQGDARAFSVYLASRTQDYEQARALAESELAARADALTLDALAWALAAAGDLDAARPLIERALEFGTRDARVLYHAAAIAAATGDLRGAASLVERAVPVAHTLLPSERAEFDRLRRARASTNDQSKKRRTT